MNSQNRPTLTRGMRVVVGIVVAVVLVGAVAIIWLFSGGPAGPGGGPDAGASPSASGSASAGSDQPTAGPVPGAQPTTGSEVQTPGPVTNSLPPRTPSTPLLPAPLPEPASATGELVDGFPTQILGPPADADVLESAIAGEDGSVVQISLIGRTDAEADAVITHYRELWASLGLMTADADGTLSAVGAYETLSLAISDTGTGTRFTVYGVFRGQ